MSYQHYDPTQYERQHRRRRATRQQPDCCPECGDNGHLVIVSDGWECWTCDAFIPRERTRWR